MKLEKENTMISWLNRIFKGMVIALGFILPGVSGGVLAAILGIYERLIHFLAHLKENFVENVLDSNWYEIENIFDEVFF